jgi:hypothetical protein
MSLVQNNERYLAFYPAVTQAFLEISDLRTHAWPIWIGLPLVAAAAARILQLYNTAVCDTSDAIDIAG